MCQPAVRLPPGVRVSPPGFQRVAAQDAKRYCREVVRILKLLKQTRDMTINEVKLTLAIEDPSQREQREYLGVEARAQLQGQGRQGAHAPCLCRAPPALARGSAHTRPCRVWGWRRCSAGAAVFCCCVRAARASERPCAPAGRERRVARRGRRGAGGGGCRARAQGSHRAARAV